MSLVFTASVGLQLSVFSLGSNITWLFSLFDLRFKRFVLKDHRRSVKSVDYT